MTMTDDNNKIITKHTQKTTISAMTMTDGNKKIITKHTKNNNKRNDND